MRTNPQISPPSCCSRRSAAICGVCSRRGAPRTVKYESAPLGSQTPHLTTAFRPRDESWRDMQVKCTPNPNPDSHRPGLIFLPSVMPARKIRPLGRGALDSLEIPWRVHGVVAQPRDVAITVAGHCHLYNSPRTRDAEKPHHDPLPGLQPVRGDLRSRH